MTLAAGMLNTKHNNTFCNYFSETVVLDKIYQISKWLCQVPGEFCVQQKKKCCRAGNQTRCGNKWISQICGKMSFQTDLLHLHFKDICGYFPCPHFPSRETWKAGLSPVFGPGMNSDHYKFQILLFQMDVATLS